MLQCSCRETPSQRPGVRNLRGGSKAANFFRVELARVDEENEGLSGVLNENVENRMSKQSREVRSRGGIL